MHHFAVYDMDKTITYAPTWTSFLVWTAAVESPWRLALLPVAALATLGYVARLVGRARLKEFTHALLLGPRLSEVVAARAADRFAERIVESGVYAGALAQIAEDRAAGQRLVLATASYGFYAEAIAARLGFEAVIATQAVRENGAILPRIAGENCYGAAKLAMIEAWLAGQGIATGGCRGALLFGPCLGRAIARMGRRRDRDQPAYAIAGDGVGAKMASRGLGAMSVETAWDGAMVRQWFERRFEAARSDQAVADRQGRSAEGDSDKAAAEEFVCRALKADDSTNDQTRFAARLKGLLDQDEYRHAGAHDDRRFEREVRAYLRRLVKMTKTNTGFENRLRYQ
ncbi:HAD family hydrolase [Sphingomonas sp. UYP23]